MSDLLVPFGIPVSPDFAKFLAAQLPKFGGKRARMAEAIGISATRLSRALNVGDYPLDVRNCLQLAVAAELPPGDVLRKAGKAEIADLIERLYGRPDQTLTPAQRELIEVWAGIPDEMRAAFAVMLRYTRDVAAGEAAASRTAAIPETRRRRRPATPRTRAARRGDAKL